MFPELLTTLAIASTVGYLSLPNGLVLGEATKAAMAHNWPRYFKLAAGCAVAYWLFTLVCLATLPALPMLEQHLAPYRLLLLRGGSLALLVLAGWLLWQKLRSTPATGHAAPLLMTQNTFWQSLVLSASYPGCIAAYLAAFLAAYQGDILTPDHRWWALPLLMTTTSLFWLGWAAFSRWLNSSTTTSPQNTHHLIDWSVVAITVVVAGAMALESL